MMKNKILTLYIFFTTFLASAQCEFQYHIKKGGLYYFSTFYEGYNYTQPRQGVCEQLANGRPYEKRVFKNGILQEEWSFNFETGKPRIIFIRERKDSILAELKMFDELNRLHLHQIFYLNNKKQRCWKEINYNGDKLWHVRYFRNFTNEEIMRAGYPTRPEHMIDEEGYTDCSGQFGPEFTYHQNGELMTVKHHNAVVSDNPNYTLTQTGPYFMYSDTKKLLQKGQYENGKAQGKFYYYDLNGKLSEEKEFNQDFPVGNWKGYFEDGKLKYTIDYSSEFYFSAGHETHYFQNGKLSSEKRIDAQGKGFERKYNEQGVLLENKIYNYYPYEYFSYITYYPTGLMKSKQYYRAQNDTLSAFFFEDGSLQKLTMNYKSTGIQESWEYYKKDILGQHKKSLSKSDSSFVVIEKYDSKGRLEHEYSNKNNISEDAYYWTTGNRKEVSKKLNGLLDGPFQQWDSIGNLMEACEYKNGFRVFPCSLISKQNLPEISKADQKKLYHEVLKMYTGMKHTIQNHIGSAEIQKSFETICAVYQFHLLNGSSFEFKDEPLENQFTYIFTLPVHAFSKKETELDSLLHQLRFENWKRKDYNAYYFSLECTSNELWTNQELEEAFSIFKLTEPVCSQLQIKPFSERNLIELDWGRAPKQFSFQIKKEPLGSMVIVNQNYGTQEFSVYENGYVEFFNRTGSFKYTPEFPGKFGYQW